MWRTVSIKCILICSFLHLYNSLDAKSYRRGSLFFYWGYNGSLYTKSDIHVYDNENYNFTLYNVKATNFPLRRMKDLFSFTAPYNFRIGYTINNKFSISAGIDHMKYRTIQNQQVRMNGYIKENASAVFAGNYMDSTINLSGDFFYMEHSDGLNYISIDADYSIYKLKLFKEFMTIDFTMGLGLGLMLPRTENYLFQQGGNHPYHLSGWGTDLHFYPKIYLGKFFFLQPSVKFGFIHLPDTYLNTSLPTREKIAQHFFFFQWNLVLGANLPLYKEELKMKKKIKPNSF